MLLRPCSSPGPESRSVPPQQVSFPSPQQTVPLPLQGSVTARPGMYQPSLTQWCPKTLSPSSLSSLPQTPVQGKIDQGLFIDGFNTQKGGGGGRDVAIEISIKLPAPLRDASAAPASPPTCGLWDEIKRGQRWVWGVWGGGAAWVQPPRVPLGLLVTAVVPVV